MQENLPAENEPQNRLFDIVEFDKFESLIVNKQPPALKPSRLRVNQVTQIKEFLRDRPRKCQSILVEHRYTDRAFMDEYKEFYATSFEQYTNYCSRLHFFELSKNDLEKALKKLARAVIRGNGAHSNYLTVCRKFSEANYLGFMVVKPLPATRIGRTVIRHPNHKTNEGEKEKGFPCTRNYTAHVLGFELSVCGLPFQQQDGGMSACASTALWASLSQYSEYEHFLVPSPAAITKFAGGHKTEFGRLIPQERGLTTAQMCQAMEGAGLSPYLIILGGDAVQTRAMLYSVVRSGFAPILILRRTGEAHAVTVGGMILDGKPSVTQLEKITLHEQSGRLESLYINDDRLGPYRLAHLNGPSGIDIVLTNDVDPWQITHMMIPLHPKIRLAFNSLYAFANLAADQLGLIADSHPDEIVKRKRQATLEFWIMKARNYRRHALFGQHRLEWSAAEKLNALHNFSRYVGVVRFTDVSFGTIDILVDLTNTPRHMNVLLVLGRGRMTEWGQKLVGYLAHDLGASSLVD